MKKLLILLALIFASPALAQPIQCPDQPNGNSTNACANTRFVINNAGGGGTSNLTTNHIFVGNGSNVAADVAMSGDCLIVAGGAITCTKSSGNTILGMAFQAPSAVSITGGTITGLPAPTLSADAATKGYVDSVATGRTPLAPVRLATTGVLSNTPTYANGAAGVGATLTAGSNGVLTIDSVAIALNDRVLIKDQVSTTGCTVANPGCQNGPYTLTTLGTAGVAYVLTRATDADTAAELPNGLTVPVTAGTVNGGSSWTLNQASAITVGTTPLPWIQTGLPVAQFWTGSGNDIYKNNTGNVGIGTTTPASLLHILGAGVDAVATIESTGGAAFDQSVHFKDTGSDWYIGNRFSAPTNGFGIGRTNSKNDLIIDSSGLVGIGTTPGITLDINGSVRATGSLIPTSGTGIEFQYAGGEGLMLAIDRTAVAFKPIRLVGTSVNFQTSIGAFAQFDTSGHFNINTTTPITGATINLQSGSAYVNVTNPTLQEAICYGFGETKCETDGILSHIEYNGSATTTGAAIRGEVLHGKIGAFASGIAGVAKITSGATGAEATGVIGVVANENTTGRGSALWGIFEGTTDSHQMAVVNATNGAAYAPNWGYLLGTEGVATGGSAHKGIEIQGALDFGVLVSVDATGGHVPTFPYAYTNASGTQQFSVDSGGNERAVTNTATSDERLKDIHGPFTKGLKELMTIKPIFYHWKDNPSGPAQAGVSAQNVRKQFPEAVSADVQGTLGVNDRPLVAALINAVKELKASNDNLRREVRKLKKGMVR